MSAVDLNALSDGAILQLDYLGLELEVVALLNQLASAVQNFSPCGQGCIFI